MSIDYSEYERLWPGISEAFRTASGSKRESVDHCSCPPDHPAHQNLLRTSENESTVVA